MLMLIMSPQTCMGINLGLTLPLHAGLVLNSREGRDLFGEGTSPEVNGRLAFVAIYSCNRKLSGFMLLERFEQL